MRKLVTLLFITYSLGVSAQMGEIFNGGFESWDSYAAYNYPTMWGNSNSNEWHGVPCVVKSFDAQSGSYSAELRVESIFGSTVQGYIYHGNVGPGGPDTGIPYSTSFDELTFYYQSNLLANDTMYLMYIRFISGVPTEVNILPAISGTAGSWTMASIDVPFGVQDQLFIGFIMGDPNGPEQTPGSWARIDNVKLLMGGVPTPDLPDQGFEQWSEMPVEVPNYWVTLNPILAGTGLENANKTLDAQSGSFALELSTIQEPNSQDTIAGILSMGPIDFTSANPFVPIPYEGTPTLFSGAYKYNPANGDQASIQMIFFANGAPIGSHAEIFNAAANYTNFNSAITTGGQPDSIVFIAISGDNPGSVLKLDNLSFSGGNVGVAEFQLMTTNIYPNPATNRVMIKSLGNYDLVILNHAGQEVYASSNNNAVTEVDLTQFKSGSYLVRVISDGGIENHHLVVQ